MWGCQASASWIGPGCERQREVFPGHLPQSPVSARKESVEPSGRSLRICPRCSQGPAPAHGSVPTAEGLCSSPQPHVRGAATPLALPSPPTHWLHGPGWATVAWGQAEGLVLCPSHLKGACNTRNRAIKDPLWTHLSRM